MRSNITDQLDQSFIRNSDLKHHMLIHMEQKPYNCDQCVQSFIRDSHLKCHMLTHINALCVINLMQEKLT